MLDYCATLTLAYPKGHVYYMLLTCGMTLLFWNLLHPSVTCDYVTMTCDRCVMACDFTLNTKPKSKKKKKKEKEMEKKHKIERKMKRVYRFQF